MKKITQTFVIVFAFLLMSTQSSFAVAVNTGTPVMEYIYTTGTYSTSTTSYSSYGYSTSTSGSITPVTTSPKTATGTSMPTPILEGTSTLPFGTTSPYWFDLPPKLQIIATPAIIAYGASTTISWTASQARYCLGSWATSSSRLPLAASRSMTGLYITPALATSTTYSFTCNNGLSTSVTRSVTVVVKPKSVLPPVIKIIAASTTIAYGASTTISWTSSNATMCTPSWNMGDNKRDNFGNLSGSYVTPSLTATDTYSLTCVNFEGIYVTKQVVVVVLPKVVLTPVLSLTASPLTVPYGGTTTVVWSAKESTSCTASWAPKMIKFDTEKINTGEIDMSGSYITPAITATTTYSVTCVNSIGVATKKSVVVKVVPRVFTLTVVNEGSGSLYVYPLSTICSSPTCSYSITSGSYIYTLAQPNLKSKFNKWGGDCTGQSQWCTFTMTDNKKIVAAYEPILAINLSASPLKTFSGKVATVSWATTGATSCQGSWNAPTSGLSMSGTFVTPPLVATTTYSMTCSNSLNKSFTKSVTITVLPATSTHLTAKDLGIIVNDNDPDSIIIANYYKEKRGIPEANIVHVKLPIKAQLTPAEFASVRTQINTSLPSTVQAVAVAWTNPSRVNCNSITSVIATDYNGSICGSGILSATSSLYYDSYSQKPFTDFKIRPAMMLAGKSVADVKALIDRGVSSDASRPKGKAYIMKTTDSVRSLRSAVYPSEKQGYAISPDVDIKMLSSNAVSSTTDTLFYFQGLASVGKIATNKFPAGAVADHLTSYGGKLTDSSQMSILEFISAGVTGTYGTVSEPYATGSKFPEPVVMMTHYTQGDSLIEAYWKSVAVPCQGIFVGDPLATPWAN